MYRGELTLIGGITGGERDKYDYNGVIRNDLTFVVRGESKEIIRDKLRKALREVKGIAFKGACDRYNQEVAEIPMKAADKLEEDHFRFHLCYDDYEDLIAGATWRVELDPDAETIILQ